MCLNWHRSVFHTYLALLLLVGFPTILPGAQAKSCMLVASSYFISPQPAPFCFLRSPLLPPSARVVFGLLFSLR